MSALRVPIELMIYYECITEGHLLSDDHTHHSDVSVWNIRKQYSSPLRGVDIFIQHMLFHSRSYYRPLPQVDEGPVGACPVGTLPGISSPRTCVVPLHSEVVPSVDVDGHEYLCLTFTFII